MKTIINRLDLHRFERLVSKLAKPSELPATISVSPCFEGVQLTAACTNAVLTYTVPFDGDFEAFTMPWTTIKEFAAKKHEYLDLDVRSKDVTLSWNLNGIPQTKTVPSLGRTDKQLPSKPDKTTTHSTALFDAIVDAGRCVEVENSPEPQS